MQAGLNPSSTTGSLTEITNGAIEKLEFGKKLDEAQTQFENDSKRIKDGLLPETTPKPQPAPQLKSNAFPRTLPLFKLAQADTTAQAAPVAKAGALTDAQRADFFKKFDFFANSNGNQVHFAVMPDKKTGMAFSMSPTPEGLTISGQKIPKGSMLVTSHNNQMLDGAKSGLYTKEGKFLGRVNGLQLQRPDTRDPRFGSESGMYNLSDTKKLNFEPPSENHKATGDAIFKRIKEGVDSGQVRILSGSVYHDSRPILQ
jgi:hypothetical protein